MACWRGKNKGSCWPSLNSCQETHSHPSHLLGSMLVKGGESGDTSPLMNRVT